MRVELTESLCPLAPGPHSRRDSLSLATDIPPRGEFARDMLNDARMRVRQRK
jgi:hypothetical protein